MNDQFDNLKLIQLNKQLKLISDRIIQLQQMIDADSDPSKMKKDFFDQQIKQLNVLKRSLQLQREQMQKQQKKES